MSSTTTGDAVIRPASASARWLAAALYAPGAVLIAGTAALLLGLPFGIDPVWRVEPLTLPEAAALYDNGEAVRLIQLGADPNAPGRVRARFLHDNPQTLTPLEAAAGARRSDMIQLLLEHGAVIDAPVWTRLHCIARDVESEEVEEYLAPKRPDGASDDCSGIQTPWTDR
jgi:hypothetical protein